jgi:exportin-5
MASNGNEALPRELPQIVQALEAIYNPRSSNEVRHEATVFLEQAKTSPDALSHGFTLASDSSKDGILRHFGLSMMVFTLEHNYPAGKEDLLREQVLHLAQSISLQDAPFLRNKTAQVWCLVAKRIWGRQWLDMDEQLSRLWEASFTHQEFVLIILETLSDDIFNREDYAAGLRQDLGSTMARICVTSSIAQEAASLGDDLIHLRYGEEGWLQRLGEYLKWCLDRIEQQGEQLHPCIIKTLTTLGSMSCWINPKALPNSTYVEHVRYALVVGDASIRTVGVNPNPNCYWTF